MLFMKRFFSCLLCAVFLSVLLASASASSNTDSESVQQVLARLGMNPNEFVSYKVVSTIRQAP